MRPYGGEASRQIPGPIRRGPSPGPPYGAPPPPGPSQQPPPPGQVPARVTNPNYTPAPSSQQLQPANGPPNGGLPPHSLMSYRPGSPRSEPRPLHDNRMPSPKSAYPQHPPPYGHAQEPGMPSGIEPGVPQPPKGPLGPDFHREHDRPPSVASKRLREWEDEPAIKKPANEENRARMEDVRHRRPSTPLRDPYRRSPDAHRFEEQRRIDEQRHVEEQRRVEEMRRVEEQRHANDGYHPSEAAHHPPAHAMPNHLPPMQQGLSPMSGPLHERLPPTPAPKEYPQDERPRVDHPAAPVVPPQVTEPERAARKMDVDEDYDDSGEEEKKASVGGPVSGPGSAATAELKTSTPTSAGGLNGLMGAPKAESAA